MNDCGETGRFRLQLVVEDKQDIDSEVGKEKIKFLFERLRFFYKVIKIIESAGEISEVDKQNIQQEIIRSLHDIKSSFGHFVSNIFVESDFLEVKSNFEELLSDVDGKLKVHNIFEKEDQKTKIIRETSEKIQKIRNNYLDSWNITVEEYEKNS
ncbi:MAG: hypothetical protein ACD_18C00114G0004 [uncultured bacterium]|nr:MAG: hypothetical protein ACD_18C00114G0004 [uncultured bacterium]OGH84847.1 MAG: hypothetical protein A2488_01705 [Candidatus Magasanikbacteria bacterium RIFOXYC12_FULL_32_21b]OGH91210.1 MAG: hypothetical protein A2507_03970 [Candidatus Magasanikbacteria bacterium RIFOXYD12_FULL_33_17]HAO52731.1 hypothetical protein [Candidatus Magasanikbacteria bacterium]